MSFRSLMLGFSVTWAVAAGAAADPPNDDQWSRLRAGKVVVEHTEPARSGGAVAVTILMQAEAKSLWTVLLSCERSFEFVDGLLECEPLDEGPWHKRIRNRVKKYALLPPLDYVIEFKHRPFELIEFNQAEGDLDVLEGSWRFEPAPQGEGLLVTHELRVRPSYPVPRWLVRRSLARGVPNLVLCLRALVGGSPDAAHAATDRAACPDPAERGGD